MNTPPIKAEIWADGEPRLAYIWTVPNVDDMVYDDQTEAAYRVTKVTHNISISRTLGKFPSEEQPETHVKITCVSNT